ncbi:hypothetical protein [Ramlibacter albus]|uniref:Uncharacterized protein n=1 Tax=Ramlibacter albus TaxID=2079448 RepID=A0A923S3I1_9BURK|nr:hypothetical protein [Ramlibacter albus]MBC5766446.1 hypothetical protein [Ramlibacter albus]
MNPDSPAPAISLADLLPKLQGSGLEATLEGNAITANHGPYAVRAEVVPGEGPTHPGREIAGVVRITSGMPHEISQGLSTPEAALAANRLATFGALTLDEGHGFVGSRLTIYKGEEHAWPTLHLPLVLFAMLMGAEPILGGLRRQAAGAAGESGSSDWGVDDFTAIQERINAMAECSVEGAALNAEINLARPGEATAEDEEPRTALLQMMLDQPHPELGGGLFCVLQLPHRVEDLARVCNVLNTREMAAQDQPPHFGAWCAGALGDNPAYVLFLPNAVRMVQGVAINAAFWLLNRALWADALLVPHTAEPKQSL